MKKDKKRDNRSKFASRSTKLRSHGRHTPLKSAVMGELAGRTNIDPYEKADIIQRLAFRYQVPQSTVRRMIRQLTE